MPTLSELRVRAAYDGKDLKAGLQQAKQDMQAAAGDIKRSADQAELAVTASTKKIGQQYAALPMAARKAYDESLQAQRAYQEKITQGMNQVGMAMSIGITLPLALAAKEAVGLAADFEQSMDVLQVSIRATRSEMDALSAKAVQLGGDITLPATSAVDAARAMNQLAKGGLEVNAVLEASRGTMQLAAATGIDAAEAATIQARALASFNLEGEKATHVADILARANYSATGTTQDLAQAMQQASAVMHQSGQTIDDTVAAITMMSKAGIVGSDAGTSLKQMFLKLMEGQSIPKVRDAMRGYGIEVYDAAGRMKSMRDIITEFTPVMTRLTDEQRNAALATIFGSDAIRSAQIILGGGVEAYDAMTESLQQEGAAAELAASRNKGLAGAIDGLKSAWETLLQSSAEPILKPMADLTRSVADLVGSFSEMNPLARNSILIFAGLAAAAGPVLIISAQLRTAWATLFAVRAAGTVVTAKAIAAEVALAVAQQAEAATAGEAAVAETALAAAETASGRAAVGSAASKATMVVANQAVAASAATAATATAATGAASAAAAGGTGLLATGMAALVSPIGLVILGVVALTAALVALHRWATAEERQAKENEKAFRAEYETAYENAKAKVEVQRQSKQLVAEYVELEKKTNKTNAEQKRFHELANKISLQIPELVKKYDSQGQAILDVAAAHKEAAKQAQNHYDKEMQLAESRLNILDAQNATDRANALRSMMGNGQGVQSLLGWAKDLGKNQPNALNVIGLPPSDNGMAGGIGRSALSDALIEYGRAVSLGKDAAKEEAKVLRTYADLNEQLRKAQAEAANLTREAKENKKQSTMSPAEWQKYQASEAKKKQESEWRSEAEQQKADKQYQKDRDAWFKANGYGGLEELSKEGNKAKSTQAETEKAATQLTAGLLQEMAKKVKTPEGAASCGFFAMEILKQTGAEVGTGKYWGGAKDLIDRVRKAGGQDISAGQAKAGDLVYYHGKQYGALKDSQGKGHHVGIYTGDGYAVDSSGTGPGHQRTRRKVGSDAQFMRPVREGGAFDTAGEMAIQRVMAQEAQRREALEAEAQAAKEVADSFGRLQVAIAALSEPQLRYAEMLGMTLDKYKQLAPEEKERAERLFGVRSNLVTDKELARGSAAAGIAGIKDPTERAVAEYGAGVNARTDITEQDKLRLIEQKRAELAKQRADALNTEVSRLAQEKQLVEATTEMERIRLQLMLSRPELTQVELDALAGGQYAKHLAEKQRAADSELAAKVGVNDASAAQIEHSKVLHEIQANTTLTDQQRYESIQDQNDALALQLFLMEQQARIASGELSESQAKALTDAEKLAIERQRMLRDQERATNQLAASQEAQQRKLSESMDKLAEAAKQQASNLSDILLRPFQDGLGKGLKGFWNSLVDGWRQTVKQMFLEWAKSQLMRSLEPVFAGKELRQYRADQSAKANANKIMPGEHDKMNNAMNTAMGVVGLFRNFGLFGFAAGGDAPYGSPVLVGEYGPEIWTPPASGGRIHNAGDSQRMMQGGGGTVVHVTNHITTPDTIGFKRSSRQIAAETAGAMNGSLRRNFAGR